ncbi:MAG: CRISPR-associated protein, partial [Bacteroidaceae bacterium]|nr:CRISPR-associated protein [Bacteroidaceae bacterium]
MKNYQYRLISRVVIEAATPLSVGSGVKDIYTDATVAKDVNNLPYIPGASIAGVVRHALHALEEKLGNLSSFFGFQKSEQGQGSEIIFSEAKMIGKDGLVIDGLQNIDFTDAFYSQYKSLPVRQHVRISDMGAAEKHGKFDEEVVLKGTRFCFEIEVVSQTPESAPFIK